MFDREWFFSIILSEYCLLKDFMISGVSSFFGGCGFFEVDWLLLGFFAGERKFFE